MYQSNHAYQKYSGQPQPTAPMQSSEFYSQSTGIPVGSVMQIQSPPSVPWSTGLCGCFEDFSNCCITCWCPCITFGQIAEIVDRGTSSCATSGALYSLILCLTGCSCLYSCFYRSKMRGQYILQEKPCADCLIHCFCEYCALCQEYRELKNRGFDMALGWHGNLERQTHGVIVPPSIESGMSR